MIRVLGLKIRNFRSWHGEHYVPLAKRGLVAVMGKNLDNPVLSPSNGAGKSGVGGALRWCLYGASDTAADAVVNDVAGSDACVTTRIVDDDDRLVVVERYRNRPKVKPSSGLRVTVNGVADGWTMLDTAATQAKLNELLGMDEVVFEAAVMFHQAPGARTSFVDLGDAEAKTVLSRILPIGGIDDIKVAADSELALCRTGVATLSGQLTSLHGTETATTARIASADAAAQAWIAEQQRRLEWHRNDLARIEAEGRDVRTQFDALPPAVAITVPSTQQAQQALQQTQRARATAEAKHQTWANRLQMMSAPQATTCYACGQHVTPASTPQAMLDEARADIEQVTQEIAAIDVNITAAHAALRAVEQQAVEARAAQMNAQPLEQQRRTLWNRREQLKANYREVEQRLQLDTNAQNPHLLDMAAEHAFLEKVRNDVATLQTRLSETTSRVQVLEWWSSGLGGKGLKSFVLDSYLALMTTEANRWVQIVTGGRGWVRFETQRANASGKKLIEQINVRCFEQRADGTIIERSIRDAEWSGGERQRYAVSIDFALAFLVAKRAARAWDLLILDEVFRYLDAGGKQAFVDVLRQLARDKSTVLVVDHDPTFTAYCDDVIVVQKHNGCSSIQKDDDAAGQAPLGIEDAPQIDRAPPEHPPHLADDADVPAGASVGEPAAADAGAAGPDVRRRRRNR